jgi:hypothetical protein
MRYGLFISSIEDLSTRVDILYPLMGCFPYESGIGTPAKADSLITVMDRSVHSHRRQVMKFAFHIILAGSRSAVSKAWTRAVTGDAMHSYIPLTQV